MMIELSCDNRESIRGLFDNYPCLHGCVAAFIEGGMGKVFVDSLEDPSVALAVLGFQYLAGDPLHKNAPLLTKLLSSTGLVIVPTPAWQHLLTAAYPGELEICQREAFQAKQFDIDKLRSFCQALPGGFELRQVTLEEVAQFATDLSPALVSHFHSHEEFITLGVGLGIMYQGKFVSGASSADVGGGKIEFEIQTHPQFRRRGLARAVGAALVLYCLEHGLEPCWDAANEPSSALARQLGFRSTGKYGAYFLPPSRGESAANRRADTSAER